MSNTAVDPQQEETMNGEPETKPELLALINERWGVLHDLLGQLDAAQLEQPLGDGWTPKQHVAHLAAWEQSLLGLLRKERRPEAMGISSELWESHDTDAINASIAGRDGSLPVVEVARKSEQTHRALLDILDSLTIDELNLPYSAYQPFDPTPNANPVIGWVHGNTWDHYNEHIGWLEQGLAGQPRQA